MEERRRTARIFVRIPIAVQGVDLNGKPFSEETTTIEVNRDGARIALKNTPRLGAEIRIANESTQFTALFRIAMKCPQSYGGAPEWGVAASAAMPDLMSDFWGFAFEVASDEPKPHISALLLCKICGSHELVAISRPEYEVLRQKLRLPRVCPHCQRATEWEPSGPERSRTAPFREVSDDSATAAAEAREGAAADEAQRRGARRVAVHVPILVRAPDGNSEETRSRDVSRTGLSMPTTLPLNRDDVVEVVVGYGVVASPPAQKAKVAWRRPETPGVKALIGVQFIGPEPSETSTPEGKRAASRPPRGRRRKRAPAGACEQIPIRHGGRRPFIFRSSSGRWA